MKKTPYSIGLLSFTLLLLSTPLQASDLHLQDVLKSVAKHHPKILQAQAKQNQATFKVKAAQGDFFDPQIEIQGHIKRGFYDNEYFQSKVQQNIPFIGAKASAGYRRGAGNFAIYDDYFKTLSDGEVFAGINLPLLKDGYIDEKRTKILISRLGEEAAGHFFRYQRLLVEYQATSQYIKWVILGLKHKTYNSLWQIAELRQNWFKNRVLSGADPKIQLSENLQIIRRRQTMVVKTLEELNEATIKLSLYLRDKKGNPIIPAISQLPKKFPAKLIQRSKDMESENYNLQTHPLISYSDRLLQQSKKGLHLKKNQILPQLDLSVKVSNDLSTGTRSLGEQEVQTGFQFSVPLTNRKARAEYQAQKRELYIKKQELRLVRDQIKADIKNILQKIENSKKRVGLTFEQWSLAKKVERAERTLMEVGQSSLFKVNIREEYSAKARIDYYNDLLEYYDEIARFSLVTGKSMQIYSKN